MDPATRDELRRLEELLLTAEVRDDAARLAQFLTDDFIEFGSSGRVFSKAEIIAAIGGEGTVRRTISDFHAELLAPDAVFVTYRLQRTKAGDTVAHSLRSSVWLRSAKGWRMRFHQGTPAGRTEMPPNESCR